MAGSRAIPRLPPAAHTLVVPEQHAIRQRRVGRARAHVQVRVARVRQDAGVVVEALREEGVRRSVREVAAAGKGERGEGGTRGNCPRSRELHHPATCLIDRQRLP